MMGAGVIYHLSPVEPSKEGPACKGGISTGQAFIIDHWALENGHGREEGGAQRAWHLSFIIAHLSFGIEH